MGRRRRALELEMKILMAEDMDSVREHLGALLDKVGNVKLRFVEQDATLLLQTIADWRPDTVIIDTRMRGMMVLGLLEECRKQWPHMAVVVSGVFFEQYYRTVFLRTGANAVFDKAGDWSELIAFLAKRQVKAAPAAADVPVVASPRINEARTTLHE
jgi:DNA-binding NarL/FixJ family response regulator